MQPDIINLNALPILLSIPDACKISGIGRSTMYEWINAGQVSARKAGRKTLIEYASLVEALNKLPKM